MSRKCDNCSQEFDSEKRYLSHKCKSPSKNRELKNIAIELKKRLDKYITDNSYLTDERDALIRELHEERDKLNIYKEKIRESYNRKLQLYREHLDLKYTHQVKPEEKKCSCEEYKKVISELQTQGRTKETKYLAHLQKIQAELDRLLKQQGDEVKKAIVKQEEEFRQQIKAEQMKYSQEIKYLSGQINKLTAENQTQKLTIDKQENSVVIAVEKKTNELRQFYDDKLLFLRVSKDKEIASLHKLLADREININLVQEMANLRNEYEERIHKLKEDFKEKLNNINK